MAEIAAGHVKLKEATTGGNKVGVKDAQGDTFYFTDVTPQMFEIFDTAIAKGIPVKVVYTPGPPQVVTSVSIIIP